MTRPTLVHRVRINATAEEVWRAITEPRFTEQYFFGLRVKSEWKRGARIVYEYSNGTPYMDGTLQEVSPPHRFRFSARVLRDENTLADLPSRVTWEIVPLEEGCELVVIHDEFDGDTATYRVVRGGWPLAVRGIKELLETGSAHLAQREWADHLERPAPFVLERGEEP